MGFLDGKFATNALLSIKGPITAKSYNAAVVALKNQKTDILCKPYYVGKLPFHIPNNTDIIVDYKDKARGREGASARRSRRSTSRSPRPVRSRRSSS